MSSRWMVWKGLLLVLPGVMYWPLTKGTVLPTMMEAGSLSRVSRFGVDSTLLPPLVCIARASTPRLATSPTPGMLMVPEITPMLRPPLGKAWMEFFPPGVKVSLPKFAPPNTRPPPASH